MWKDIFSQTKLTVPLYLTSAVLLVELNHLSV